MIPSRHLHVAVWHRRLCTICNYGWRAYSTLAYGRIWLAITLDDLKKIVRRHHGTSRRAFIVSFCVYNDTTKNELVPVYLVKCEEVNFSIEL